MNGPEDCSAESNSTSHVAVLNRSVGRLEIGIGWNDSSCLDGRWPEVRVAGAGSEWRPFRRRFSAEAWDRYFDLLDWSGCHWLRHAITISDFTAPTADRQVYRFDSRKMQQHYLVLDQAERRGIRVLLANWHMGAEGSQAARHHPADEESFATALAALVHHLKRDRGYKCVWALSLWNEPNLRGSYHSSAGKYPDSFWPLYVAVDRQLKIRSMREEVCLLGPEASTGGNPHHIVRMLEKYGLVLDIVADHDYSALRGVSMSRSLLSYDTFMQRLCDIYGRYVPFVISEFGNYGNGPGPVNEDELVYDGALSTTAYLIRMLNRGASGFARWEFMIYGAHWRNFGALTRADNDYLFSAYAPVYYPHAITARYLRPGWEVREVDVAGANDSLSVTALTSPQEDLTIMLLNDDSSDRSVVLTLGSESPVDRLSRLMVRPPISEGIVQDETIHVSDPATELCLPPKSITVLTSLPPGDLGQPGMLALKRTFRDRVYHRLNRQASAIRRQARKVLGPILANRAK